MATGKLKNADLEKYILKNVKHIREDVLLGPGIGEDVSAIAFGDQTCLLSTDPITGAIEDIGKLAVHININDIAASGGEPVGLMVTLLCPENTEESLIQKIMVDINETANACGVEIVGGHTEITSAVNRVVVSVTAIGRTHDENLMKTANAKVDEYIYITKHPALEGTAILAKERQAVLKEAMTTSELAHAESYIEQISVLKEAEIGRQAGVSAMHDITEGGVLGAVHELCEATGLGCKIYSRQIELLPETEKICEYFGLNPLRLVSSGSMMMTVTVEKAVALEKALVEAEIDYARIGILTESTDKLLVYGTTELEEIEEEIEPPSGDELYKVLG